VKFLLSSKILLKQDSLLDECLRLLNRREKYLLIVMLVIQIFLGFLDLAGVALIGLLGNLTVIGFGAGSVGNRAAKVLDILGLEDKGIVFQIATIGILASIFLISKTIMSMFLNRRTLRFLARRSAALSQQLVLRYFNRSVVEVNKIASQGAIFALTNGVSTVTIGIIGVFINLVADIAILIILGSALFYANTIMAFLNLTLFALVAFVLYYFMHTKVQILGQRQARLGIKSQQNISALITAYRELTVRNRKAFSIEEIARTQFRISDDAADMAFFQNISKHVLEITVVISGLILCVYQFSTDTAARAIATLAIFLVSSSRLVPAVLRLQQGVLRIKGNSGIARPTLDLIRELKFVPPLTSIEGGELVNRGQFNPIISVNNLNFEYEREKSILRNLDFSVEAGEICALVGSSGAGKTTLMDLMLGLLSPTGGSISISGEEPLKAFQVWPGFVGYVPQDVAVYEGTIRQNIGMGFPERHFDEEEYISSLEKARLWDFVRNLPEGLDTQVGDRGTRLSGGQRQRLGIARCLITEPRLVFFDEATSALDSETESSISQSILEMRGKVTIVIIAHRLSTIKGADKILFLDHGKIEAIGNFGHLLKVSPKFAKQASLGQVFSKSELEG